LVVGAARSLLQEATMQALAEIPFAASCLFLKEFLDNSPILTSTIELFFILFCSIGTDPTFRRKLEFSIFFFMIVSEGDLITPKGKPGLLRDASLWSNLLDYRIIIWELISFTFFYFLISCFMGWGRRLLTPLRIKDSEREKMD
jgi:hypothetical protein